MSDWQCTEITVPKHLAFSRKQLVERIEALESKLDKRNRALFDNIKEIAQLKAKLDAAMTFCERAVNAYPDLRDEYEALQQEQEDE